MAQINILSILIWLPIIGGGAVLFAGRTSDKQAKGLALLIAIATFVASIPLVTQFDISTSDMQFVELRPWINTINANYHLGVDGFAVPLILLTTFMTVLVVIAGWQVIQTKVSQYFAAFLIMEGLMNGVFASMDALLFYVFWEAMLIPMFLIIGVWGGPRRVYATIKFFLYTFFGSVFLLIALIYLYLNAGTFEIAQLQQFQLDEYEQLFLFLAFLIAFAVKVPMWPIHTWLPDAHVEAPTGGVGSVGCDHVKSRWLWVFAFQYSHNTLC